MLGAHVLDPRHLGVKTPITIPAEIMIWALHVVPPPRIVAIKIEVAVITGPVGIGILLVLPKGSIVWEPSLTAIAICHQTVGVQRLKVECVSYQISDVGTRSRIYTNRMYSKSLWVSHECDQKER